MKVKRSCKQCRVAKAKCDSTKSPCTRCSERGVLCSGVIGTTDYLFLNQNRVAMRNSERARRPRVGTVLQVPMVYTKAQTTLNDTFQRQDHQTLDEVADQDVHGFFPAGLSHVAQHAIFSLVCGGSRRTMDCAPQLRSFSDTVSAWLTIGMQSHASILHQTPSGNSVDPFTVLPLTMDSNKYSIMQHFVSPHASTATAVYQLETTARETLLRSSLTSEVQFYAFLGSVAARLKHVTKEFLVQSALPERYALRAVQLMRVHLENDPATTEQTLLILFFLMTTSLYNNDWDTVKSHRNVVKHLLAVNQSLSKASPLILQLLWRTELNVATHLRLEPIRELFQDIGHNAAPSLRHAHTLESAYKSFEHSNLLLELEIFSSQDLLAIVREVVAFAQVMVFLWDDKDGEYLDRHWSWARAYCCTLSHRLLSHGQITEPLSQDLQDRNVRSSGNGLVEECIRLGMILWLKFACFPFCCIHRPEVGSVDVIDFFVADLGTHEQFLGAMQKAGYLDDAVAASELANPTLSAWMLALGILTTTRAKQIHLSSYFVLFCSQLGILNGTDFEERVSSKCLRLDLLEKAAGNRLTNILYCRKNLSAS
ncbi:hypothetical protein K461DRAFT_316370 [Myriangium duriaei CBS 260.36]|uniref:Zn(2)-C6 fungal-type domain-containing protein n=1 Tax=Myriangium duriaei CBS 260.36 TaxID=1168546 RepID=A0A9P4MCC9_9PEZI|nr:hypothetical protein K461DRAFT_316370 [Myriangium duriaei CBS 260.36]